MTRKEFIEEKLPYIKKYINNHLKKSPVKELKKEFNENSNLDLNNLSKLIDHFDNTLMIVSELQYYYVLYTSIYKDDYEPKKELIEKAIQYFKDLEEYENCIYIKSYFNI